MLKKASFIAIILLFFVALPAFARSGCCSHHGGVMSNGCGCNDGTPLSDTCAPYYACSAPQTQTVVADPTPTYIPRPTSTPKPVLKKVIKPTPTKKPKPTKKPVKKIKKVSKNHKNN